MSVCSILRQDQQQLVIGHTLSHRGTLFGFGLLLSVLSALSLLMLWGKEALITSILLPLLSAFFVIGIVGVAHAIARYQDCYDYLTRSVTCQRGVWLGTHHTTYFGPFTLVHQAQRIILFSTTGQLDISNYDALALQAVKKMTES